MLFQTIVPDLCSTQIVRIVGKFITLIDSPTATFFNKDISETFLGHELQPVAQDKTVWSSS